MPRRDDDSGEYDRPSPARARGGGNAVLWVVLGVAAALVLLCGGGGVFAVLKVREAAQRVQAEIRAAEEQRANDPKNKVYTRDEFRALLMGKTEQEVIDLVGRPDSTDDNRGPDRKVYTYKRRTHDPISSSDDLHAYVYFEDGKVDRIRH